MTESTTMGMSAPKSPRMNRGVRHAATHNTQPTNNKGDAKLPSSTTTTTTASTANTRLLTLCFPLTLRSTRSSLLEYSSDGVGSSASTGTAITVRLEVIHLAFMGT